MSFEKPLSSGSFFLVPLARTFASIKLSGNATAHTRATRVGNGTCFSKRRTFFRGHGSFCRPFGACPWLHHYPRLAPWAAFLRRFAADHMLAAGHAPTAEHALAAAHTLTTGPHADGLPYTVDWPHAVGWPNDGDSPHVVSWPNAIGCGIWKPS